MALAAMGALASSGSAYVGARNFLNGQADRTRRVIPRTWEAPPRADGVYAPGGVPVERWSRGVPFDLHLMVFGDSTATGLGCRSADEVPGVLLARGLADETGKRIRLSTKAISGATSKGLSGQVDAMFVAGPSPDAAVIMIGANDITALNGLKHSARRLGAAVRRLRASGAVVVVGTCPDFGVITAIPQPLRWTARTLGLRLARAQAAAVRAADAASVPLADLLAPEFLQAPELMFATTNSTRRQRVTRSRPSSFFPRCATSLASGPAARCPSCRGCRARPKPGRSEAGCADSVVCGGGPREFRHPSSCLRTEGTSFFS